MTAPPAQEDPSLAPIGARPPSPVVPLALWLGVQLAALAVSAYRVPFAARFPSPAEGLAFDLMLAVQTAFSALLFPLLFRDLRTGAFVVGTAPVFTILAAALASVVADASLKRWMPYVPLWLAACAAWGFALRTPRGRQAGSAVATLLVLGGAVCAYLDREFGHPTATFDWARHAAWGPLVGGLALRESWETSAGTAWAFLGITLLAGLLAATSRVIRDRRPHSRAL